MSFLPNRAIIIATGLYLFLPFVAPATASNVQLLPPTDPLSANSPCTMPGSNQVLVLNGSGTGGESAINCNDQFTADPNQSVITLPRGTTAKEPAPAAEGMLRYNNEPAVRGLEFYNGTLWMRIPSCAPGSTLVYDTNGQLGCSAAAPIVTQVIMCPVGYYPPPDNSWGCQADCPPNTTVISGGSQASAFSVAPGSGVYSMPNGNGWLCDVGALSGCSNGAAAPCGATCYAVCATLH